MKAKYYILKKTSYDGAWVPYTEPNTLHPKKSDPGTDLILIQVVGIGESVSYHTGIDAGDLIVPQAVRNLTIGERDSLEHKIDDSKIHRKPNIPDYMVIQKIS